MGINKIKVSELPSAQSLSGLHVLGVDSSNTSVKVSIELLRGNIGATGKTGLSAYDLALAGGYTGTQEEFATEAAALANNSARLTNSEIKVSQLETKTPNTLYVILTQSTTDNLSYTFTKASFDSVASAYANGATIFVDVTDNRAAAYKTIDLSKRYEALWNKTLKQVEVSDPNIARGFYVNGITPSERGCVSTDSMKYLSMNSTFFKFNAITGYYTFKDYLTDITESEMVQIYHVYGFSVNDDSASRVYQKTKARIIYTNRDFWYYRNAIKSYVGLLYDCNCEVFCIDDGAIGAYNGMTLNAVSVFNSAFRYCRKLKIIDGKIDISLGKSNMFISAFDTLTVLETVNIFGMMVSLSFTESTNLTRDSILYMINNSANTTPIIVTLHATATARLTPEDIALASSKNITIA